MNHPNNLFPICSYFKECAGCSEHLSFKPPSVWEEVLSFFPSIRPLLHTGAPLHWRHRAKMAVRGTVAHPLIGLFKRSSHDILSIPTCLVHHPHLNQAFEMIQQWMCQNALIPYEEKKGYGELRYLQGVVQRKTGRVQLTFILNFKSESTQVDRWRTLIHQLGEAHPTFWHSLWLNFNDKPTNTIFGTQWVYGWGEKLLWEQFEGVNVCYGPSSFGQANLLLFEQMLIRIRELVPEQACVTEFYAGVGVIGLFIAAHCQWVQCVEIHPYAEDYFNQARSQLPSHIASRLTFFSGATQKSFACLTDATTVIVDPPRKGLDSSFFSALKTASSVQQLLYISCGWEAFKQDCQRLIEDGWKIRNVEGYLFFPGSNHVELLVHFERKISLHK